jgi:nucleotide-binding universal stress UspA family protein
MRRILTATDFSPRSDRAIRRAGLLAREFAAGLTIVHVVDDDKPKDLVVEEKKTAEGALYQLLQNTAELRDISCETKIALGEPFEGIIAATAQTSADLIVMGAHRKKILRDIFVGTTLERVVRSGPRPVLMVNMEPSAPYRRGLAAVDLSDFSRHALQVAKELGFLGRASVTVLHAVTGMVEGPLATANMSVRETEKAWAEATARASRQLDRFLKDVDLGEIPCARRLEGGPPVAAISKAAKDLSVDFIVIGTHGRSGLTKLLLGSVAEEVLREIDRDILAVPAFRNA